MTLKTVTVGSASLTTDSRWEYVDGYWEYMFFVSEYYGIDEEADRNNMQKHLLLEVLSNLNIIRYERGYDSLYYDIIID